MKQLRQFALTVLVALVGSLSANAHDFEAVNEGSTIYYTITSDEDLTCAVSFRGYNYSYYDNEYSGSVVIPSSVGYNGKTYSVTSIGGVAFYGCSGLTSINIPNSVTEIGEFAFYGCSGLTSINIPNSVTEIGDYAFEGCTCLPIENGIRYADTYAVKAIDKNQTSYTIKEGTRLIGSDAFRDCRGLTSINIPNSVTSIGPRAFFYCSGLTSINIPNSVTSIGSEAFSYCSGLTSIKFPSGVTSIETYAFNECYSLTTINIPNSVTSIGSYAFHGCSSLNTLEIPNSVKSIGEYAFFKANSYLTTLELGNGIEEIKSKAFGYCNEIYVSWASPAGLNIARDAFTDNYKSTLYVPIGCTSNYQTRTPWNDFKEIKEYVLGGNDGDEKCAEPEISVQNNKLLFTSSTPDSKFYYTIDCLDQTTLANSENGVVDLSAIYKISVYAYAKGYQNSETVTATLVWVNPTLEGSNVISMETKKAVVIMTAGDNIQICGTEQGENIQLYSISGMLLCRTEAADSETLIPYNLQKGESYIIKYGDKAIKCRF